jgi:hypothetical protein
MRRCPEIAGPGSERHVEVGCPAPLGLWRALSMDTTRVQGGRAPAAAEVGMKHAPRISRAQAVALPNDAPAPAPATEWIVAGIAVLLLLAGLVL